MQNLHSVPFRQNLWIAALASLVTLLTTPAFAIEGLQISELPSGGDVTIPGDYPVYIPRALDVVLTGMNTPQSMTLSATTSTASSTVRIYSQQEKKVRTITIQPGSMAVYNFRDARPIRVKVVNGDVKIRSVQPLKVQR